MQKEGRRKQRGRRSEISAREAVTPECQGRGRSHSNEGGFVCHRHLLSRDEAGRQRSRQRGTRLEVTRRGRQPEMAGWRVDVWKKETTKKEQRGLCGTIQLTNTL